MLVSVGVGLAMLGTCTAQKAHLQSVTVPAQLEVTMRTQPLKYAHAKGRGCAQCPSQDSWRSLQAMCMGTASPLLGGNRLTQGL